MSQFDGGNKVRCIDCTQLSGKTCSAKGASVSPKKRRTCGQYNFKGEYENSTPLPATYLPHVDKKTKQLMKRLMKMGVIPTDGQRPVQSAAPYDQEAMAAAPVNPASFQSTATANIPIVRPLESVGEVAVMRVKDDESEEGTTVVWSPDDVEKGAENVEK
jgi:hypothetical protein